MQTKFTDKAAARGEDSYPKAKIIDPEAMRSIAGGSGELAPPKAGRCGAGD